MKKLEVQIWTDGSCLGNPGPGGWAAILHYIHPTKGLIEKEISGHHEEETTNNRMEIAAVIEALRALKTSCYVTVYCDSSYVVNAVNTNLEKWVANNWRTSTGKSVMNQYFWLALQKELAKHAQVRLIKVEGHAGIANNERCDLLAKAAANKAKELL